MRIDGDCAGSRGGELGGGRFTKDECSVGAKNNYGRCIDAVEGGCGVDWGVVGSWHVYPRIS